MSHRVVEKCAASSKYAGEKIWFRMAISGQKSAGVSAATRASNGTKPGAPSITVSALSRDTCTGEGFFRFCFSLRRGFRFGVASDFCSFDQGSLRESSSGTWFHSPSIRSLLLQIMIRYPDSPTARGGKVPHQQYGELLRHQGAPRAALHANQLRITGLAAQHPVHANRQLAGDRNLGHAPAAA